MLVVVSYIICVVLYRRKCLCGHGSVPYCNSIHCHIYISLGRLPLPTLDLDGSLLMVMTLDSVMFLFILLQEPSSF